MIVNLTALNDFKRTDIYRGIADTFCELENELFFFIIERKSYQLTRCLADTPFRCDNP